MTALDFPLNPNDGDTHGNYVYDATHGVWNQNPQQLAARFISSDTAPTSPSTGDAWFDTESGKTYVYHDSSWVESGNPVIGYVDPYDQASTSTGYLALPKGTDAQRPLNPVNGDMRFNTESGEPEWYSEAEGAWFLFKDGIPEELLVNYLVIAGGGGGGQFYGGGGGAGGYITSVEGENSGGLSASSSPISLELNTNYQITVGGGGAQNTNGENSIFATVTATGGGAGATAGSNGFDGGSGGGASYNIKTGGQPTTNQGFKGGDSPLVDIPANGNAGAGGGGAGSAGVDYNGSPYDSGANGGVGISSSITGSAVVRAAGGGGGAGGYGGGSGGSGGSGIGGNGAPHSSPSSSTAGQTNTGSGGGGGAPAGNGNNGGSGVVIITYPDTYTMVEGPGLTSSTTAFGGIKTTVFTSGSDNIYFV